ncbi:MAG: UMP kinase [Acidilobaceae archaeon]
MVEYIVVKISGRLLTPPRLSYLSMLRDSILESYRYGGLAIVTGGGPLSREYIGVLRELSVPESILDVVGIYASRLNALALASILLPYSTIKIPESIEEAVDVAVKGLIPVIGGLQPGQSTNAVATSLAEALKAKLLLNMLDGVDGVYKPPPGVKGSRRLDRATYDELEEIIREYPQIAGRYELIDNVALSIARRSNIRILFVNGQNPQVIPLVIRGEKVTGTIVEPS